MLTTWSTIRIINDTFGRNLKQTKLKKENQREKQKIEPRTEGQNRERQKWTEGIGGWALLSLKYRPRGKHRTHETVMHGCLSLNNGTLMMLPGNCLSGSVPRPYWMCSGNEQVTCERLRDLKPAQPKDSTGSQSGKRHVIIISHDYEEDCFCYDYCYYLYYRQTDRQTDRMMDW